MREIVPDRLPTSRVKRESAETGHAVHRDAESPEIFQLAQLCFEHCESNWLARLVKLGAIAAGKIAAAHDHHLC